MSVDEGSAFSLAARNLAIAEKKEHDVVAPCAGCYLVLNKTNRSMEKYPNISQQVKTSLNAIGMEYIYLGALLVVVLVVGLALAFRKRS